MKGTGQWEQWSQGIRGIGEGPAASVGQQEWAGPKQRLRISYRVSYNLGEKIE